ncbi:MAG: DUF2905 domain-containing protein [Fibrobacterota bacterium]
MSIGDLGRYLIICGMILFFLGLVFLFLKDVPDAKLMGDIFIRRSGVRIYIPVTTAVLVSVLITLIVNIFLLR